MMEDKLENNRLKYIDYTFKRHGIDPDSIEGQLIYYAYGHGYHQAEKDLELTVDEIKNIDRLLNQCVDCSNPYQEVLKRFKEMRENGTTK